MIGGLTLRENCISSQEQQLVNDNGQRDMQSYPGWKIFISTDHP